MRAVRETMRGHVENPVLLPEDVGFIEGLTAGLDDLAAHWNRLEEICHGVQPTLVHGDFNGRNIRLRTIHGDATLAVFDWEEAGWGVPAVDLAQQLTVQSGQLSANPDVSSYWSAGREGWPDLSSEACWRLAYCGTVFRTLSAMSWIADDLANDWAHASLRDTRLYAAELEADRKSTRLNSSHSQISYAVFCLKKKKVSLYASHDRTSPLLYSSHERPSYRL